MKGLLPCIDLSADHLRRISTPCEAGQGAKHSFLQRGVPHLDFSADSMTRSHSYLPSINSEIHCSVDLFADVINESLFARLGERIDSFSSMINEFRGL
jgi:hypothetical protein